MLMNLSVWNFGRYMRAGVEFFTFALIVWNRGSEG